MIIQLSNLARDLPDLPALQPVSRVEDGAVLLLELPQLCVDVERPAEVADPLTVSVRREIAEPVEQLFRLFQQMDEFGDDLAVFLLGHDAQADAADLLLMLLLLMLLLLLEGSSSCGVVEGGGHGVGQVGAANVHHLGSEEERWRRKQQQK